MPSYAALYLVVVALLATALSCGGAGSGTVESNSAGSAASRAGSASTPGPAATAMQASNATVGVDFGNGSESQVPLPAGMISVNRGLFGKNEPKELAKPGSAADHVWCAPTGCIALSSITPQQHLSVMKTADRCRA